MVQEFTEATESLFANIKERCTAGAFATDRKLSPVQFLNITS
jgi:hypothetical protein